MRLKYNKEQLEEYNRVKNYFKNYPKSYYSGYCSVFVKNGVNNLWVERIKRLHRDKSKVTLYRLFLLHGKKARQLFDEYKKKQALSNTYEYKKSKYGWSYEDFKKYNKRRAVTLENMINRYGDKIGRVKFDNYRERQRYAGSSLEYFCDKYGKDEGIEVYNRVCKYKGMTKENFIRKYGSAEGERRFFEYMQNKQYSSSHLANSLFDNIYNKLSYNDKSFVYYLKLNKEFGKYDNELKCYYKYDFTITNKKICIEFNGDYWHANPLLYKESDYISLKGGKKLVGDIWKKDLRKKEIIEKCGYKLYYVWEMDYRENPKKIEEDLVNEITRA